MMNSPFFLSEALVHALGWTLLHSLWQGSAIALILWIVLPRLKKASQRYWVAYGALVSVFAAAAGSFIWVYTTWQAPIVPGTSITVAEYLPEAFAQTIPPVDAGFWSALVETLEPYNPVIVTIWLLGFSFFLFRLAGGMHYLYQLRHRQNQPLAPEWQEKLQDLATRIGLSRPVYLLESALAKTPMALGFLKPLILLPVGMANQLSPAEVEAILAHELAHIARRDWLFNLFQAIIEALFYFHPAVWWMASTIRAERENCCDDTAVAVTGNRLVYAKTLVRLQDLSRSVPTPNLALGMEGPRSLLRRRPLLLERIKRILHQPQQSASLMEKTIALAILVALISLWTVRANTPPALVESIREIAEKPITWFAETPPQADVAWQAVSDSVPEPKTRQKIVREDGDKVVEMALENGEITELKIDGETIKPADYGKYQSVTDGLREEVVTPPTPPSPPEPFGFWTTPDPPNAPRAPRVSTAPLRLRSSSKVSTETDDSGNTIIRVERNGEPLEIRVKDGEVWVEDEKIEEGDIMDIDVETEVPFMLWNDGNNEFRFEGKNFHFTPPEGMHFEGPDHKVFFNLDKNGNHYLLRGKDGQVLEFPEPSDAEIKRLKEDMLILSKEQQEKMTKELKAYENAMKKNQKEWDKAQQDQYKSMQEVRRALEKSMQAQKGAVAHAQREQRAALRQAERSQVRALQLQRRAESFSGSISGNLLRDKLIDDPDNYSFDLSNKDMKVNGKKQSKELHQKYLNLYRKYNGKELGKDKVKIRVQN